MTLDVYLEIVNRLLVGAAPIGAYCMGFSGTAFHRGYKVTEDQIAQLRACATIAEGDATGKTLLVPHHLSVIAKRRHCPAKGTPTTQHCTGNAFSAWLQARWRTYKACVGARYPDPPRAILLV